MAANDTTTYEGIGNENEFYSQHYLAEIFQSDIKDVLSDWQSQEAGDDSEYKAPYTQLRNIHTDYFKIRDQIKNSRGDRRRIELQRDFFKSFLPILGYDWNPHDLVVDEDIEIPVLSVVHDCHDAPMLIAIGAFDPEYDQIDPLSLTPNQAQFHSEKPASTELLQENWNAIITRHIYGQSIPPRWILLLSDAQLLLIDRTKWNENRLLRFDWTDILGRRETNTLKATTALLHRSSLVPEGEISLLDTLDESSHKHAFAVSEDLKYAIRHAIELLGNEAVVYLIENTNIGYTGKQALDATQLTRECLRYMYRLLFIFYIEARPELGYVPLEVEAYRDGYSLESLRNLELVRLTSEESRKGYFFHHSIRKLFDLIHNGYIGEDSQKSLELDESIYNTFRIQGLDSHLFDPKFTPLLDKVQFDNETLQTVIQLMSLTKPAKNQRRRGRISYAQLGINQLGAVYEALLSYRGFFAEQDLYEVKKAGTEPNELDTGYFVPATELGQYADEECVYDKNDQGHKKLRMFPKGTFIYRLAGRDRKKSASYYTPEVLTKTLVKYALKELLKDKTADDILKLTICEPAMGSAAFLNEAVIQIAEAYLDRKQKELEVRIPQKNFAYILRQTKTYIADRNVFGVDLNPTTVELAEISLWLNCIHGSKQVPWFGYQLFAGNSLIGARRQFHGAELLRKDQGNELWYESEPSRPDPENPKREPHQIYHFLLSDPGMANYKDKVVKNIVPNEIKIIQKWRNEFCKPFEKEEIATLQAFSEKVDELWGEHTRQLTADRERTEDEHDIWGQTKIDDPYHTSTLDKDQIRAEGIFNLNAKTASAYRRLKMVMDYWCALWFWPIDKADLLPDRDTFIMEIGLLLTGNILNTQHSQAELDFSDEGVKEKTANYTHQEQLELPGSQTNMDIEFDAETDINVTDSKGRLRIEKIFKKFPRLKLVQELAERHQFFHWELSFADVFKDRGGFDLILGNPPWIKVEWEERGILSDFNPLFNLRNYTATKLRQERSEEFIKNLQLKLSWLNEYEEAEGTQNYLNSYQNYGELKGIQTNLYKCFLPQAWYLGNPYGICGFLHPEGVFDDPKGGGLRAEIYPRLKYHFQFQNEFQLFTGTNDHGRMRFGLHIYNNTKSKSIEFDHISNLFSPNTIDICYSTDDSGDIPGIKNDHGEWNTEGHASRIVRIDKNTLGMFSKLYDKTGTPAIQARLPAIHSQELISVLEIFSKQPLRLEDLNDEYFALEMWHETNAQNDGTIKRQTQYPSSTVQWILSGPHIYLSNPYYKTPRSICSQNSHYDILDLTSLPLDYLPRSNYIPACDSEEYRNRIPRVSWVELGKTIPNCVTDYYQLINRRMVGPSSERTCSAALLPKDIGSLGTCFCTVYKDHKMLLNNLSAYSSLPYDFLIKSTGKTDMRGDLINRLPILQPEDNRQLHIRSLVLNCLTSHYEEIWSISFDSNYNNDSWTKESNLLTKDYFTKLTPNWNRNCALRKDYERRQALLELDVLVAIFLELSLDQLLTIYRVQFPVMQQYEGETFYDTNGRIVFTPSKGLIGVGLPRTANNTEPLQIEHLDGEKEMMPLGWEDAIDLPDGTKIHRTIMDDTLPGGPREKTITYEAPWYLPNREEDYKVAWEVFTERFKDTK